MAATDDSDDALLAAWRSGDRRAGSLLFDRHFRALTRFFRNKLQSGMDDLIQQTMCCAITTDNRSAMRIDSTSV